MVLEILTTSWQATAFRIGPRKTRSPPGWSLNFVACKPVVKTASSPGNSTQWAKRANFTDYGRFLAQQIEIRSIEAVECNTTNQHFLPGLPNFMDRTNKTNLQSIYNRVTTLAKQRLAGLSRNTELDYCDVHGQMVRKQRRNRVFPWRYASWHHFDPRRSRLQSCLKLPGPNHSSAI